AGAGAGAEGAGPLSHYSEAGAGGGRRPGRGGRRRGRRDATGGGPARRKPPSLPRKRKFRPSPRPIVSGRFPLAEPARNAPPRGGIKRAERAVELPFCGYLLMNEG